MGAKASTANGGEHQHHHQQSPRTRTFSTSSSSDVVNGGGAGFNLLRAIPGIQMTAAATSQDRQRARSLSSVPDLQNAAGGPRDAAGASGGHDTISIQQFEHLSPDDASPLEAHVASALTLNRVFTATSLPSHWSLNGTYRADIKCPFCNKFVLSDDIECHLVMCLTKPRLSYNEDILSDAKGECVICLDDLSPGDVIARLPCLCVYHKGCIDKWFEVNRSCPEHPGD
ncbi:E3 ubiquitin-protein ligase znrf2 isoform X1 [Phlebotomus argentipes]|uniref:E3 ubiquitin-protein ligase znrf2 isoform X1 n=1 Tax=Phlebotomus argentipes TaxID=94469 RepID=UPI002892B8EC|nr:E3 ubiquitin-protein ligase znrf2 isoform X1 [Phlebotomus argentipes]